jgi:hypothetical protein
VLGLSTTELRFSGRLYRYCQSARSCLPQIRRHIADKVYDGYINRCTRCSAVKQSTSKGNYWLLGSDNSNRLELSWLQSSVHGTTSLDHTSRFEYMSVDALHVHDHAMSAHARRIVSLDSCHDAAGLACSQARRT